MFLHKIVWDSCEMSAVGSEKNGWQKASLFVPALGLLHGKDELLQRTRVAGSLLVRCCHKICVNQIKSGQTADLHLTLLLHEIVWVNLRVFTEILFWFLERFMQQCTIGPLKYSPNLFEIFTKFVPEKFYDHFSIIFG